MYAYMNRDTNDSNRNITKRTKKNTQAEAP